MVKDMVGKHFPLEKRNNFEPERMGFTGTFSDLPLEQRMDLIQSDPEYGDIFCRCERITKREIRQAIENPLGVRTMVSIKYRSRAMMGRCQGGFCVPRIVRMLQSEYGYAPEDFLARREAPMFDGYIRKMGDCR